VVLPLALRPLPFGLWHWGPAHRAPLEKDERASVCVGFAPRFAPLIEMSARYVMYRFCSSNPILISNDHLCNPYAPSRPALGHAVSMSEALIERRMVEERDQQPAGARGSELVAGGDRESNPRPTAAGLAAAAEDRADLQPKQPAQR
jgi:hypothetical protein